MLTLFPDHPIVHVKRRRCQEWLQLCWYLQAVYCHYKTSLGMWNV